MIPRIQPIELNSITAATAWKEYAHMISKRNLKKIADAGLMEQNSMKNSIRGLNKKVGAKIKLYSPFGTAHYRADFNDPVANRNHLKMGAFRSAVTDGYRAPAIFTKAGSYSNIKGQLPEVAEALRKMKKQNVDKGAKNAAQLYNAVETSGGSIFDKLKRGVKKYFNKGHAHEKYLDNKAKAPSLPKGITAKARAASFEESLQNAQPAPISYYKNVAKNLKESIKKGEWGPGNEVYLNKNETYNLVKKAFKPDLQLKDFNKTVPDIIHHELLEGLGAKTKTYSKNRYWWGKMRSHVHPNVLVREAKKYNQTGGKFSRSNNFDILDLRKETGELDDLRKYLKSSDGTGRLRNRDYKKAIRDWERDNK